MLFVSIVCPIYNEEKFISNCLDSIVQQDFPKEQIEVFLIDGMSTDRTRIIIRKYAEQYPYIYLLDNPQKIVPPALNIGIKAAKGDVIIRLDGHCIYPSNYVSLLTQKLFELKADNVGAVWNTLPAKDTSICRAIAIGASHKFGIGNSMHKLGTKSIIETDTVPFGCFRRDIFDRIGFFDEDLIRTEDDEFNARIIKNGGKIFLIPDLVIKYYARDRVTKMMKMFYQYGLFKPLVYKKIGYPATIRQFFPMLFLVGLLLGGILSCFSNIVYIFYLLVILFYMLISICFSIREFLKWKDWKLTLILPYIFFTIHISYGWGYLKGIYHLLMRNKIVVNVNR
ncbi:MAG: glycosyltransferase family 2 protein [Mediterranea sp.]|jgi:glycosyltransferase involved in cell wall biosynthesis|nr:glycosyltransferase family 2 protein [Mediterranea sp.]